MDFMVPGGIVAFHAVGEDYGFEGVTRFYNELLANTPEYTELFTLTHLAVVQRQLASAK